MNAKRRTDALGLTSKDGRPFPFGRRRCYRKKVKAAFDAFVPYRRRVWIEIEMAMKMDHLTPYDFSSAPTSLSPRPTAASSRATSERSAVLSDVPTHDSRPSAST